MCLVKDLLSFYQLSFSTVQSYFEYSQKCVVIVLDNLSNNYFMLDMGNIRTDIYLLYWFADIFFIILFKGLRHPWAKTKSSTVRILNLLLNTCRKRRNWYDISLFISLLSSFHKALKVLWRNCVIL